MPSKSANVKNEKQYEALKDKGMSKERAAKIANSPGASERGGKGSGSGGDRSQGGTPPRRRRPAARAEGRRARSRDPGDALRLLPVLRGVLPRPAGRTGRRRRRGRLRLAVDQRPLPPLARRAGPEPVRVGRDRRDRRRPPLPVTTAVTCPTVRMHPAIVAQAAATAAVLLEGRFELGVGSGEALNEHILGDAGPGRRAPRHARGGGRADAAAVGGRGGVVVGWHYTRRHRPDLLAARAPPAVYVCGLAPKATDWLRGSATATSRPGPRGAAEAVQVGVETASRPWPAPRVVYAPTKDEGVDLAHRIWPNAGLPGDRRANTPLLLNGPTQGPIRRRISTMSV